MASLNAGSIVFMKKIFPSLVLLASLASPLSAFAFEAEQQKQTQCPIEFKKIGQCASVEWRVAPKVDAFAEATIKFWSKKTGTPSGPYQNPQGNILAVSLWMPSMGHGSSPIRLTVRETGVVDATKIYFSMPGVWDLRILQKNGTQVIDQAAVSLNLSEKGQD